LYNCKKRFFIMVYTCDRSDQITNFFKIWLNISKRLNL
jgi:hypothetical protein